MEKNKPFLNDLKKLPTSILKAVPHAVIGLRERTIIFANPSVERVFGWKPEELIGKKTRLFYRSDEEYEEIANRFYPILEKEKYFIDEFPCRRKDGEEILCRISASVIGEEMVGRGIVAVYEDITEYKGWERKLIESEKKYREVLQNVNAIILRWNSKGEIIFVNDFGLKFFGFTEKELVGKHVVGTIVPETENTVRDLRLLMDKICEDPKAFEHNINENMKKDGSRVWIEWINKPILGEDGKIEEIFSAGIDITHRKKMEKELEKYREHLEDQVRERTEMLERLNRDLKEANERLRDLDRLKSMFIASMSHELRTPLNSVIGFSSILLNEWAGPLNSEQKENLAIILKAGRHLLNLINDVIDISKIEAGKVETHISEFDLYDVIIEAGNQFTKEVNEKKLNFEVEAIHQKMHTDRKRLLQCILNLLGNAIKFTEKGFVKLTIQVEDANSGLIPKIVIIVEDTGIGIKEGDMAKLFQPFTRIESPLKAKVLGTGLGLYLTRKIVTEILKGEIEVKSRYGEGSVFRIRVPVDLNLS